MKSNKYKCRILIKQEWKNFFKKPKMFLVDSRHSMLVRMIKTKKN